jgi:hypothetical protein
MPKPHTNPQLVLEPVSTPKTKYNLPVHPNDLLLWNNNIQPLLLLADASLISINYPLPPNHDRLPPSITVLCPPASKHLLTTTLKFIPIGHESTSQRLFDKSVGF